MFAFLFYDEFSNATPGILFESPSDLVLVLAPHEPGPFLGVLQAATNQEGVPGEIKFGHTHLLPLQTP